MISKGLSSVKQVFTSCLLLAFLSSMSLISSGQPQLVAIDTSNLTDVTKENPFVLVLFYRSSETTEGPQKILEISQSFIKGTVPSNCDQVVFASVDIEKNQAIEISTGLHSFPGFVFYYYGIPLICPQIDKKNLQTQEIKSCVVDALLSLPSDLTSLEDPDSLVQSLNQNPLQVVFLGSGKSRGYSLMKRLRAVPGNSHLPVDFADASNEDWQEFFGIQKKSDHIFLVSLYTGKKIEYKGELNLREVQSWLEMNKLPSFFRAPPSSPALQVMQIFTL